MAIQYLSKRNSVIVGLVCIVLSLLSCNSRKVLNIKEVFDSKPSHVFVNSTITNFIEDYEAQKLDNEIDDTYIVYIIEEDTQYKIHIAKVYFPEFRKVASKFRNLKELKGYLKFENNLILLYGDTDAFFKEETKPKDIMYNEYKEKEPLNYEPYFVEYYIKKSK